MSQGRSPGRRRPSTAVDFPKTATLAGTGAIASGVASGQPAQEAEPHPGALGEVLQRAIAVVKQGQPALVDVICQGR